MEEVAEGTVTCTGLSNGHQAISHGVHPYGIISQSVHLCTYLARPSLYDLSNESGSRLPLANTAVLVQVQPFRVTRPFVLLALPKEIVYDSRYALSRSYDPPAPEYGGSHSPVRSCLWIQGQVGCIDLGRRLMLKKVYLTVSLVSNCPVKCRVEVGYVLPFPLDLYLERLLYLKDVPLRVSAIVLNVAIEHTDTKI